MAAEDAGWTRLCALVASLTPEQVERAGYYPEGWSAKDLLAHIGTWLAEAGVILEQISAGTYRPEEIDVETMNRRFLEAMHDLPLDTVRAQASASRTRMRQAWGALPTHTPEAAFWIDKAGPDHYQDHLPRLGEWVEELRSTSITPHGGEEGESHMITGVRSAGIMVDDQDRAKRFWTETIGFELLQDTPMGEEPGSARWIEVAPADRQCILVLFTPEGQEELVGRFSNVLFNADDIVKTFEDLKDKGVELVDEPRRELWGWWASFKDPDGNTYGLGQTGS